MLDNARKRRSAANSFFFLSLPAPDGAIDPGDRLQVSWQYRGIVLSLIRHIVTVSEGQGYSVEIIG